MATPPSDSSHHTEESENETENTNTSSRAPTPTPETEEHVEDGSNSIETPPTYASVAATPASSEAESIVVHHEEESEEQQAQEGEQDTEAMSASGWTSIGGDEAAEAQTSAESTIEGDGPSEENSSKEGEGSGEEDSESSGDEGSGSGKGSEEEEEEEEPEEGKVSADEESESGEGSGKEGPDERQIPGDAEAESQEGSVKEGSAEEESENEEDSGEEESEDEEGSSDEDSGEEADQGQSESREESVEAESSEEQESDSSEEEQSEKGQNSDNDKEDSKGKATKTSIVEATLPELESDSQTLETETESQLEPQPEAVVAPEGGFQSEQESLPEVEPQLEQEPGSTTSELTETSEPAAEPPPQLESEPTVEAESEGTDEPLGSPEQETGDQGSEERRVEGGQRIDQEGQPELVSESDGIEGESEGKAVAREVGGESEGEATQQTRDANPTNLSVQTDTEALGNEAPPRPPITEPISTESARYEDENTDQLSLSIMSMSIIEHGSEDDSPVHVTAEDKDELQTAEVVAQEGHHEDDGELVEHPAESIASLRTEPASTSSSTPPLPGMAQANNFLDEVAVLESQLRSSTPAISSEYASPNLQPANPTTQQQAQAAQRGLSPSPFTESPPITLSWRPATPVPHPHQTGQESQRSQPLAMAESPADAAGRATAGDGAGSLASDEDNNHETDINDVESDMSPSDSDDESIDDAEREWQESLREVELLASMVLVPFLGKWVGRRCAYWAWAKFMNWKYPVEAIVTKVPVWDAAAVVGSAAAGK